MNSPWSAEQRRCLAALGFTVYQATAAGAAASETATESESGPLKVALLKAAGLNPSVVEDASSWLRAQHLPPLSQLRGDPAAKRALWPRLRALRRAEANR